MEPRRFHRGITFLEYRESRDQFLLQWSRDVSVAESPSGNATRVNAAAATALVAVRMDGGLVGGAAVAVTGDAALLYSGATLTARRGSGVQTATILARLATAKARGATWASINVIPGSAAARAAQSTGFTATTERIRISKTPSS
jgi:hypothetical protein